MQNVPYRCVGIGRLRWKPSARRWLAVLLLVSAAATAPHAQNRPSALRITSPLGRAGLPGTVRIVASLDAPARPVAVRFYIDRVLLSTDIDGPPYDALWVDENPFAPLELSVEAEFDAAPPLRDTVILEPLELTEAVDVRKVLVDAMVLDDKGRFVAGLSPDDFELFENGARETVDLVRQERQPVIFTLLVDSSQSMKWQAEDIRKTAARLLEALEPEDRVIVAPFKRAVESVTGPTADRQTVLDAIAAIKPSGGTAILDSIREVIAGPGAQSARRAIVLITDGYDEDSTSTSEEVVRALSDSDVTLYALGVGGVDVISLKDEKRLTRLTEEVGGRAWFPRTTTQLADAYQAIVTDFTRKYLLTYTPSNQRRDGAWRAISLRVRRPELKVQARSGYAAPAAPAIRTALEFTAVGEGDVPVSLTADQVIVRENGVLQEVDTFQEAVLPVTIMLALDRSGSMTRSATQAQDAARRFVTTLRPEDDLGLITFADTADTIHTPDTRRDLSLEAIDAYTAAGGTALYDALYEALTQVGRSQGGRRVVVVVTDGRDENAASDGPGSLRTWDEVLALLQRTEATVYPVGIGSRVDATRLQQLAEISGGTAYFQSDTATLAANYEKILDELRRRYVVGYESTDRERDGAWRQVEVTVAGSGVSIRSRGGYFAPAD